jgi:hypothetical protein
VKTTASRPSRQRPSRAAIGDGVGRPATGFTTAMGDRRLGASLSPAIWPAKQKRNKNPKPNLNLGKKKMKKKKGKKKKKKKKKPQPNFNLVHISSLDISI